MDESLKRHGVFSWNELLTTDPKAAAEFYTGLFGWKTVDMEVESGPMAGKPYTLVLAGDQAVGGIMPMPPDVPVGVPPHWGSYVTVDDLDAAAKKVVELGGKVLLEPQNVKDVGRFCVIQDPQGAVLSVISYLS